MESCAWLQTSRRCARSVRSFLSISTRLTLWGGRAKSIITAANDEALKAKENNIKNNWRGTTWEKCGQDVLDSIRDFAGREFPDTDGLNLWVDLTLSYAVWRGGVTGIIRSELILAHYLEKLVPGVRFSGFHEGKFFRCLVIVWSGYSFRLM